MDIKFHVNKIIDNGGKIGDWTLFVDQLKEKKYDRDLLVQVLTIALNNSTEKTSKQYKRLFIGLANLQSESSIDFARKTFKDANNLDIDCAVVCVFYAQFEVRQNRKSEATSIIRNGKMDGRTPRFLLKNAYHNLRDNKSNLFDGITDPWDDSLHDITATATIKSNPERSPINKPIPLNGYSNSTRKMLHLGKPTRSGSSLLKESTPKSPTEEVKAKLGLIGCSASKPPNVSLEPVRPPSSEKEDSDEKQYRPTLSPFSLTANTPKVSKEKKKLFETPQGFNFNIFESLSKQQTEKKRAQDEADKDIVTSLDFQNSSLDEGTVPITNETLDDEQRSVFLENEGTCCIGDQIADVSNQPNYPQEVKQKKSSNFDKILAQVDDDIKKSRSFLNQTEHKTNHALFQTPINKNRNAKFQTPIDKMSIKSDINHGRYPTPINVVDSRKPPFETPRDKLEMRKAEDLVQGTCPKRAKGPPSSRKPLSAIKGPRNPDIAKENAFNFHLKKRIPFKNLSTPGNKPREIPHDQKQSHGQPLAKTGLTELIQSIDLLKENSPPSQGDVVNDHVSKLSQPSQNSNTIINTMHNTGSSQPTQTIINKD
ncbi:uncharacterized protein [Clytia hemisphaerica]|uniref:uncharacterized protein n=1 Tax=Clytia hemisphaerica TaxID=252671 RepID=UPI0034D6C51A